MIKPASFVRAVLHLGIGGLVVACGGQVDSGASEEASEASDQEGAEPDPGNSVEVDDDELVLPPDPPSDDLPSRILCDRGPYHVRIVDPEGNTFEFTRPPKAEDWPDFEVEVPLGYIGGSCRPSTIAACSTSDGCMQLTLGSWLKLTWDHPEEPFERSNTPAGSIRHEEVDGVMWGLAAVPALSGGGRYDIEYRVCVHGHDACLL